MQIDGYVQALREDLARIAAVGDESTARAAELLAGALESALGRRLLEALGEAALELSGQLEEGRVEVRFAGSDPELVLVRDEAEPAIEATDEAYTARISLRLPESLKVRLEAAAARDGVSVNTWLVQALVRHAPRRAAPILRRQPPPPHRLRPELKGVAMFPLPPKGDAHWVYDDPSGVPETPAPVQVTRSRSATRSSSASRSPPLRRRRPPEMAEHRFHTPEPVELEIKVPSGDIDIETIDGDESVISLDGDEKLIEMTEVRQEGRRIVVELKGKKAFGLTISIGDFSFGSGSHLRVRARVPHGSTPVLSTAAADMKVRGRVRSLEVKSASGDLVVNGEIERDAEVKTVSGDVRLDRVGGDLRVQTVSGDVNAQSVGGSVVSKTVSGDLRIESVREGHVTAQSVSGDIELGVASERTSTWMRAPSRATSPPRSRSAATRTHRRRGPALVVRGKTVSGDFRVFRGA